jgi:hypothetical protein
VIRCKIGNDETKKENTLTVIIRRTNSLSIKWERYLSWKYKLDWRVAFQLTLAGLKKKVMLTGPKNSYEYIVDMSCVHINIGSKK